MLIRPVSDLHLEFGSIDLPALSSDKETVLTLAGDIGVVKSLGAIREFMLNHSLRFKAVIYVLGNHEHYRGNLPTTVGKLREALVEFENVHVLEKDSIVIGGVAFIGATLWTDMDKHSPLMMERARGVMNDYKSIRTGPLNEPWKRKITPSDTVADHVNAKHFIFSEIVKQKELGNKVVVISHHAPSHLSIADMYKGDALNGAYVSELYYQIADLGINQPNLWQHGHTHITFDYHIENTRVVCNPRGYSTNNPADLNEGFESGMIVEI